MSVIDPLEVAAQRAERRAQLRRAQRGNPVMLLASLLLGALLVATGAASGVVGGAMFDSMRISSLTHFFDDVTSVWEPLLLHPLPIMGAVAATIIVGLLFTAVGRRYTGGVRTPGLGQLTLWLIGFAGGFWWLCTQLTPAPNLGVSVDPAFGRDEQWGVWQWTVHSAEQWLPIVFATLALLAVIIGVSGRIRHRSRNNALAELVVSGRRATGTVTETIDTSGEWVARYGGTVVVKFADAQGTTRWFRTLSGFDRADVPAVGSNVIVLFDAQRPDDTGRLYWTPGDGRTTEEFTKHLIGG